MRRRDGDLCCLWWGEKWWIKRGEEDKQSRELHLDVQYHEIGLDMQYHEIRLKYSWIWLYLKYTFHIGLFEISKRGKDLYMRLWYSSDFIWNKFKSMATMNLQSRSLQFQWVLDSNSRAHKTYLTWGPFDDWKYKENKTNRMDLYLLQRTKRKGWKN